MDDLIKSISDLKLESLPKDWVSEKCNSYFSKDIKLPIIYTKNIGLDNIQDYISVAISSLKKSTELRKSAHTESLLLRRRYSWKFLLKRKVPKDALMCFLSFFIKININDISNVKILIWATDAARLYTLFLSVPGATKFYFFHPQIFKDTFELLKIIKMLVADDSNYKNKEILTDGEMKEDKLLVTDKQELFNRICLYLCEMSEALDVLELSNENIHINKIAQSLISIISLEKKNNVLTCTPPVNSIGYAVFKAYEVLTKLCSEKHGNVRNTLSIFKEFIRVMYKSMAFIHSNDSGIFRDQVFTFILNLVQKYKNNAFDIVIVFIQQMCVKIPNNVYLINKITSDIIVFIQKLPSELFQYCIVWAVYLLFTPNIKHRVVALEIISKFLTLDDGTLFSRMHEFFIPAIIFNFFDKSPLIRFKCLRIFASCFYSKHQQVKKIMNNLFVNKNQIGLPTFFDFNGFFNKHYYSKIYFDLPDSILPPGNHVVKALGSLTADTKIFVRSEALEALYSICLLNKKWINNYLLKKMKLAFKDASVLIRERMAKLITDLIVAYPKHKRVIETWVDGVMTLLLDNDFRIQEKALEFIYIIMFGTIKHADEQRTTVSKLPWRILRIIAMKGRQTLLKYICKSLVKEDLIEEFTLTNIASHTNSTNSYVAWYLIVSLSDFIDYPNPGFIYEYYVEKIHLNNNCDPDLALMVMDALFLNVKHLPQNHKDELFPILKSALENFEIPFHLIGPSLNILALTDFPSTKEFCGTLTKLSGNYILSLMEPSNTASINANSLSRYIFTLGEAALFHPGVSPNTLDYISKTVDSPDLDAPLTESDVDLRCVSVTSLSNICLQDLILAKKYIPMLAILLNEESTNESVKINILAALYEHCIRFPSVVEDHISFMCLAMKDISEDVRKSALMVIIKLLSQNILKLDCPLVFYLLTMLLDPCQDIVNTSKYFISNIVEEKSPSIFARFFTDAIYFFNDCEEKNGFGNEKTSNKESILFDLSGLNNFKNRQMIYQFMLSVMKDGFRIQTLNNILIYILGDVCEDRMELDTIGNAILKDALYAIACPEMRLKHLCDEEEDKPIEENTSEHFIHIMAKKLILREVLKRNYIELLVPIVGVLWRKLLEIRSPLAADLRICLQVILKDYKKEVKEIFDDDPVFASVIAVNLKDINVGITVIEKYEQAPNRVQVKIYSIYEQVMNAVVEYESILHMLGKGPLMADNPQIQKSISFLTRLMYPRSFKSDEDEYYKFHQWLAEGKSNFRKKELTIFQPYEQSSSLDSSPSLFPSTSTQSNNSDTSISHDIPKNKRKNRGKLTVTEV